MRNLNRGIPGIRARPADSEKGLIDEHQADKIPERASLEQQISAALTRREFVVKLGAVSAAVALPAVLAACGSGGGDASGTQGEAPATGAAATGAPTGGGEIDTVTIALAESILLLDSARSLELATAQVMNTALEGLLVISGGFGNYELSPRLATTWDQPDALTYVYELREGVTFWDGTPLTVEDVVFSMQRSANDEANWGFAYAAVDTIEATGPMQLTVKLNTPDPAFRWQPSFSPGLVVSKVFVEEHGDNVGTPNVLTMGTGPYQITEFVPDTSVTLERYDDYWGDVPAVKTIVIQTIPDRNTQLLAAKTGDIDAAFEVPLDQAEQWNQVEDMTVTFAQSFYMAYSFFNTTLEPWSDRNVRKAIAHSLDQPGIVESILGTHGAAPGVALAPQAAFLPLLSEDELQTLWSQLPVYEFDLDRAQAALAQSSVPNGFSATIETSSEHSVPKYKAMLNLSQNLADIGVTLNVDDLPFEVWNERNRNNEASFNNSLWILDFPDPIQTLGYFLSPATSDQRPWTNYRNPEIQTLLDQQAATEDPAERGRILMRIMQIAGEALPFLPIFFSDIAMPLQDSLQWTNMSGEYFNQPWGTFLKPAA